MPHMNRPHDNWASVYDTAYERSFGSFYDTLTEATLDTVSTLVPEQASIIDFGAGTGRLAIPLARMGYEVTAVEPSPAMAKQLEDKAADLKLQVRIVNETMQEFEGKEGYDLALCVFTVILYLLDDATLQKAFSRASEVLKSGGKLLLDIPTRYIFQGFVHEEEGFMREVRVDPVGENVYRYHESLRINEHGATTTYEDTFKIRYWPQSAVFMALDKAGFELHEDLNGRFAGSGSRYMVWQKR